MRIFLLSTLPRCANIARVQTDPNKPNLNTNQMQPNTYTIAMLSLSTLDAVALGTLDLTALEASLTGLLLCATYAAALRQMR